MAYQEDGSPEPHNSNQDTGLESRLRRVIITNALSNDTGVSSAASGPQARPPVADQNAEPQRDAQPTGSGHDEPRSPRAARKRPNQAQRRQMSSQLSIPIDRGPPQGPPQHPRPGLGFSAPPSRPYDQRNSPGNPHSSSSSWAARPDTAYGHTAWHRPVPNNYGGAPWGPRHRPQDRSVSSQGSSASNLAIRPSVPGQRPPQNPRRHLFRPEDVAAQAAMLDRLCYHVVSSSEIERPEIAEKEAFRQRIQAICRQVISLHEVEECAATGFPPTSVQLQCFGSLSSGFATKASDMDLGLLSPLSAIQPDAPGSPIPRLVEKAFLDAGLGARLLSRTRVPIIKLCEQPPAPLRDALIAEREKWESGVDNSRGGLGEEANDHDIASQALEDERYETRESEQGLVPATQFEIPYANGETRYFQLKQGPNNSLTSYCGLAKRILRRAGGRDVTFSNAHEFLDHDWIVLNRVCEAFVRGLYDTRLRERLEKFPSLSFRPLYNTPSNRSLSGVLTQVEGEEALMAWEMWPAKDLFHDFQPHVEQTLLAWQNLQWSRNFGVDPASYARELQLCLDKIKRIPSIQLAILTQGHGETSSQYMQRTRTIQANFQQGMDPLTSAAKLEVNARYISGIFDKETRDLVTAAIGSSANQAELEEVGQLHKIFQLSRDLEKVVEKGPCDSVDLEHIRRYIELLRSPLCRVQIAPREYSYRIPVPPELSQVVVRIRELPGSVFETSNSPRTRHQDPLEFPATGAGVQCDINFSAHLALHNTALLRCYSLTDPRVRPMVLFVKHWAKVRAINSGYRGTLSSYGYVLMVLHYLVNVARPFVCPNLQQLAPRPSPELSAAEFERSVQFRGYNIQFWRNENEIMHLASNHQLNHNTESVGSLLRGFFEYFAQTGVLSSGQGKGFDWGRDVLSLRTQGGLLSKQEKGWTGAKTVFEVQEAAVPPPGRGEARTLEHAEPGQPTHKGDEVKEVRHRYLFAVEDPFELDHNVARTVTHNGIVSIRDEFRRAWRIIRTADGGIPHEDILQDVKDDQDSPGSLSRLLDEIHGPQQT
ncbi:RNA uridylyltransferase [Purpureocillium takamizusanense]|uniref:polynucleotide adenylyltransferase n=1 Tax=Purpureocillium takamizusanense TaxID=2060973 RepID=A0A9Q8QKT7_9HYPO|nr:RNA uridylyltransferase [Purpureocillium takamizusanense]UNI20392.1 RNA uridylyltransferase [Purpureocillium takamizusanense]